MFSTICPILDWGFLMTTFHNTAPSSLIWVNPHELTAHGILRYSLAGFRRRRFNCIQTVCPVAQIRFPKTHPVSWCENTSGATPITYPPAKCLIMDSQLLCSVSNFYKLFHLIRLLFRNEFCLRGWEVARKTIISAWPMVNNFRSECFLFDQINGLRHQQPPLKER